MSWQEGAGFRVVGTIKRIFVSPTGKFAEIKLSVNVQPHPPEIVLKSFDRALIGDMKRDLRLGQRVQFTGKIENEKLQDRQRNDVKVDGYDVWLHAMRPTKYEIEGSSRVPAPKSEGKPAEREPGGDDDDPMGGGGDPMGGGSDPFGG